jgi:ubiquinone/menaquinone biosynthesis C-methylase UbiE
MADWAREYFERGYAQRWGVLPVTDKIRAETNSLWSRLRLRAGIRVVDLGCGPGRYTLAFAAQGGQVVGLDSAAALLAQARSHGRELDLSAGWVQGDMRAVPLRSASADVVVLMDAFGFFDAEAENERVLAEAARVLRPRGQLVLKVVNGSPILDAFRPVGREDRDGVVVTISRTLSAGPARMTERLSIVGSRGSGEYERRQRLYRADELSAAANRAGFEIAGMFADASGARLDAATSPTMWVIGERG